MSMVKQARMSGAAFQAKAPRQSKAKAPRQSKPTNGTGGGQPVNFTPMTIAEKKRAAALQASANGQAGPVLTTSLSPKRVFWMWHPYIPANQITLLGGRGGSCKGLVSMSFAASITKPNPWPDGTAPLEPGNVLWCETEDPLCEVIVPREIAADVDRNRFWAATREWFASLSEKPGALRGYIVQNRIALIVLSPAVSFLKLSDINAELDVRAVLERLQSEIEGTGCAVLGIAHLNKKPDLAAIERLLGSVAFTNFVRCVLLVAPENVEDRTYRMVHAKYNLSCKGDDWLYTPKHTGQGAATDQFVKVEWLAAPANVEADSMFDKKKLVSDNGGRKPRAADWLIDYLKAHNDEALRAEIMMAADADGYSESAIRKAQERQQNYIKAEYDDQAKLYRWSLAW